MTTTFMAMSQSLVALVTDLRGENETLDELFQIHQKWIKGKNW